MKLIPTCPQCGGHNIVANAYLEWNMALQVWDHPELNNTFWCVTCEGDIEGVEMVEVKDGLAL